MLENTENAIMGLDEYQKALKQALSVNQLSENETSEAIVRRNQNQIAFY